MLGNPLGTLRGPMLPASCPGGGRTKSKWTVTCDQNVTEALAFRVALGSRSPLTLCLSRFFFCLSRFFLVKNSY